MGEKKFSAKHHLPRYSKVLMQCLTSPALIFFVLIGNLLLIGCIAAFYYFEKEVNPHLHRIFDAVWWGVTTVTTVGYGDIVPTTIGGKIVSMFLMISGVSFFVGFSAVLFSTFMDIENRNVLLEEIKESQGAEQEVLSKLNQILERLERLETK